MFAKASVKKAGKNLITSDVHGQLVQAISYAVALSCGIYEIKVQLRLFDAFSKTKGNFLLACELEAALSTLFISALLRKSGSQSKAEDATF